MCQVCKAKLSQLAVFRFADIPQNFRRLIAARLNIDSNHENTRTFRPMLTSSGDRRTAAALMSAPRRCSRLGFPPGSSCANATRNPRPRHLSGGRAVCVGHSPQCNIEESHRLFNQAPDNWDRGIWGCRLFQPVSLKLTPVQTFTARILTQRPPGASQSLPDPVAFSDLTLPRCCAASREARGRGAIVAGFGKEAAS